MVIPRRLMAAVLRASGPDFDVDAFVAGSDWDDSTVYRRGEALFPNSRRNERQHPESGLNFVVSEAGFHEFPKQIEDAIQFLNDSASEVQRLVAFPGVTAVVLDFGIAWRDVVAQSDRFPAELVRLAGSCGIALELSHYPVSNGAPAAG
jgi:hypothetical protein